MAYYNFHKRMDHMRSILFELRALTDTIDTTDMVSSAALTCSTDTCGIVCAFIIGVTSNIHCGTITSSIWRSTSHIPSGTLTTIRAKGVCANGIWTTGLL